MIQKIKLKLARFLARDYLEQADERVNSRVAKMALELDPWETVMRDFHGIFSKEFQRVEEPLNEFGRLQMMMWGYGQANDPAFIRMTEWIMNSAGNQMLKAPTKSVDGLGQVLMYGKAEIAATRLLVKEVNRLASLYEDYMNRMKEDPNFNSETSVE